MSLMTKSHYIHVFEGLEARVLGTLHGCLAETQAVFVAVQCSVSVFSCEGMCLSFKFFESLLLLLPLGLGVREGFLL